MLTGAPTAAPVRRSDAGSWAERLPPEAWFVAALVILGAVLRLATLTSQSYWFDEAQAAHEMQLSFGAMLHTLGAQETSPPLWFVLAWIWAKVFGTSEAGLRSLSAIAGTAAIPVAYLCGRELVSRRAGLVAAALVTVSPFMIWYSQEAREYMLMTLLSGASLWWFARSLRDASPRNLGGWATFSALSLLTHFYAGFLVAPEALWLLWRARSRACWVAVGVLAAVELALLPLAISDTRHPIGWIKAFPLSLRIQQVPVAFGYGTLYQSSWVTHGLLGGAVAVAILAGLVIFAGGPAERRGAAIAGSLAATVLVAPLLLALLGHDYYIERALMPAWIPLAVVVGAACTAPRARVAGAVVGLALLASFVYANIRINQNYAYQRPDWRGVAAALGKPTGTRAVVVYDGALATDPLEFYLPGAPWGSTAQTPVTVSEVDVVGNPFQTPATTLPHGVRLLSSTSVKGYLVDRFALAPAWHSSPAAIGARAGSLLPPGTPDAAVLIQAPAADAR